MAANAPKQGKKKDKREEKDEVVDLDTFKVLSAIKLGPTVPNRTLVNRTKMAKLLDLSPKGEGSSGAVISVQELEALKRRLYSYEVMP